MAAPATTSLPDGIVADFNVVYDGKQDVSVTATIARKSPDLEVAEGAGEFLDGVEASPVNVEKWSSGKRDGDSFALAPCQAGACRIRYKAHLRTAAKKLDELETASEEGSVLIAPPATWLLSPPRDANDQNVVRFHVTTPPGSTFATGVYRAKEDPDAWDITLSDLWTSPYSAFGPLRKRALNPSPNAKFEIAFGPGKMDLSDEQIEAWAARCQKAIVGYYGEFPIKQSLLIVIPGRGRAMGEGKTLSGGGGTIFLRVGERATLQSTQQDWVLTHEMVHLTFPTLSRQHHWAEEGVATYVEPWARVRTGWLPLEDAWKGVVEGVPNGMPEAGDQGLDNTHTWGRTYWGGALFFLLADVGIRQKTGNKYGLEHALRGINAAGGNNAVRWPIEQVWAVGDKAVGTTVLTDLYKQMANSPFAPDLPKLWKDLGVVYANGKVTFDDTAPSANIRKAITTPD